MFAFSYRPKLPQRLRNGWEVYSKLTEYTRMGINLGTKSCPYRAYARNGKWETAESYPQVLVVPRTVSDDCVAWAAKVCEQKRFPVLTYLHQNGASLWRAAKPIVRVPIR